MIVPKTDRALPTEFRNRGRVAARSSRRIKRGVPGVDLKLNLISVPKFMWYYRRVLNEPPAFSLP